MQEKSLKIFDAQIERVRKALGELGAMGPGTLTRQYRQPQLHQGGYYQLSYTHRMKSHTEYVRTEEVRVIRQEVATYQRFKKLMAQWVDLALERSRLRTRLERAAAGQLKPTKRKRRSNVEASIHGNRGNGRLPITAPATFASVDKLNPSVNQC